jgi:hypothetical protein
MPRRSWWLVNAAALVAAAVLGGAAVTAWQHVRPSLPSLDPALPVLDETIATVVTAVGDTAAVAVSGLLPSSPCQNTPLAKGSRFSQSADLYTSPGEEDTVIGRVAAALPARDHPQRERRTGSRAAMLTAHLDNGVALQVLQIDSGWVVATARTDCRATTSPPRATLPLVGADAAVDSLLSAANTSPDTTHSELVSCLVGRVLTIVTLSQPTATDNLPARLAASVPAGTRTFTSSSNRLGWRDQTASTIVAPSDDGTRITVQRTTSTC